MHQSLPKECSPEFKSKTHDEKKKRGEKNLNTISFTQWFTFFVVFCLFVCLFKKIFSFINGFYHCTPAWTHYIGKFSANVLFTNSGSLLGGTVERPKAAYAGWVINNDVPGKLQHIPVCGETQISLCRMIHQQWCSRKTYPAVWRGPNQSMQDDSPAMMSQENISCCVERPKSVYAGWFTSNDVPGKLQHIPVCGETKRHSTLLAGTAFSQSWLRLVAPHYCSAPWGHFMKTLRGSSCGGGGGGGLW